MGANFRLNDHVAINLELNANMLSDKFNSKKGRNADWQFNALAGLTFTLGKSYRKTAPVYHEVEPPVTIPVAEEAKSAPVVEQPKKETVIRKALKQIASLIEYMKKYPTATMNVTGYADVNTGNPGINRRLSEARANNVAEALKAKGIAADRIIVDFKGDTVQPYSTPEENRVSICIAE